MVRFDESQHRRVGITLADAKARLSELLERAAQGETLCITRRGKPVAQITAMTSSRKPLDFAAMRALTDSMPVQNQNAGDFVRDMRDADRY